MSFTSGIKVISQLIKASRPEWSFIFAGVAYMLEIYYQGPDDYYWIGIVSIFLFGWGHFSLNAFTDKESDRINPRKLSLRNPFTDKTCGINKNHIITWTSSIWFLVFLINILYTPNPSIEKWIAGSILIIFSLFVSISYSVKSLGRLKARPILDLISTAAIFAFFIPLYLYFIPSEIRFETTGLIINLTTTIGRFFSGVLFTSLLVLGIHMPTILCDLEQDRQVGDMTTAVWLDAKNKDYPFYFTAGMMLVRVGGFALMNVLLMISSVIAPSYLPFILGMIEILLVIRMLRDKNRQSAINLWKGVIVTSMIGGILFGILYSSV